VGVRRGDRGGGGHDVRDLTLESLGSHIGMVFQDTFLFHASIADNLRYARSEPRSRRSPSSAPDRTVSSSAARLKSRSGSAGCP
jgi:ATP-binding cassette, subfamily B, bacterial